MPQRAVLCTIIWSTLQSVYVHNIAYTYTSTRTLCFRLCVRIEIKRLGIDIFYYYIIVYECVYVCVCVCVRRWVWRCSYCGRILITVIKHIENMLRMPCHRIKCQKPIWYARIHMHTDTLAFAHIEIAVPKCVPIKHNLFVVRWYFTSMKIHTKQQKNGNNNIYSFTRTHFKQNLTKNARGD